MDALSFDFLSRFQFSTSSPHHDCHSPITVFFRSAVATMDDNMSDAPVDQGMDEEQIERQKQINEEYKMWKKNSVFLYDMLYSRALEWPTLTAQWLPDKRPVEGTNLSTHRVILGTHTSGQAQNYLQVAHVDIPDLQTPDLKSYDEKTGEVGGYGDAKKPYEFKIVQKINHPGEVNKARYQPQNPEIIASLCVDGKVLVFDRTKHPNTPKSDGSIKFEAELQGHDKEGFGLSWSPLNEGHLVTGSEDMTVRTWDLKSGFSKGDTKISPTATYTSHTAIVNDAQYHPIHGFLIGSVSDDRTWKVTDTRVPSHKTALYSKEDAHADALNSIAFHPQFETMFATGSADHTIALWDLRNFAKKLHTLNHHTADIIELQWHPQDPSILASSSYDRRICMWDLSRNGEEQTPDEADDGPPEL